MVYARVHDQTVADDYFKAMAKIEARMTGNSPADTFNENLDRLESCWKQMNELGEAPSLEQFHQTWATLRGEMLQMMQNLAAIEPPAG